jgi:hypothetical protein
MKDRQMSSTRPLFAVLAPNLKKEGQGHHYIYNVTVQEVVESLGWSYQIAVPRFATLRLLPDGWIRCLPVPPVTTSRREIIAFLKLLLSSIRPFYCFLRSMIKQDRVIIFIESINPFSLLAFAIAFAFIPKNNFLVWFLYRAEHTFSGLNKVRGLLELTLQKLIEHQLPVGRFKLLTDTALFAKWYGAFFRRPITVLPIPHTHIPNTSSDSIKAPEIICWMAGQQHIIPYNVATVRRLVHTVTESAHKILFIVSDKTGLDAVPGGANVKRVANILPQKQYHEMLLNCDIVLLPYDPSIHFMRTSGIFVECVIAGKIPVVSKDTWMAMELDRHNLSELCMDWNRYDIIELLLNLSKNETLKQKLKRMKNSYRAFHNKTTYAKKLRQLFEDGFG